MMASWETEDLGQLALPGLDWRDECQGMCGL